ncbi:hypothetical protein EAE32_05860 [Kocuria tytonicola]|uniref:Transporter n=1 Tax=Kocuria tytonicola TaxID=2055946 RepID=A0A3L9LE34_9MICC|nr:hypothetical protein EAE32_05860 [Kocuria tytonicola]
MNQTPDGALPEPSAGGHDAAVTDGPGPETRGPDAASAAPAPAAAPAADAAVPDSVRPAPAGQERVTHRMGVLEEARRLAGLKWRILRNTLTRSTWVLVGTILGGLYALFILGMLLTGMFFLGTEPLEVVTAAGVLVGSVLLLGWWLMPVLSAKADATLDPARLALFPLSTTGLLAGQVIGALIGIPGVLTVIALAGWLLTWRTSPAAMTASVVCAVLAALLAFTGARCASALAARIAKGRRSTEIISILSLLLIVLLGPIFASVATGVERVWDRLPTWASVLGWSPLGAVWAIPGDVGTAEWGTALARLLVVLVTLAALVAVARLALGRALADAAGGAARATGRSATGIGLLDRFPARPWGAVAARSLIYWLKDPRYSASLIMIPALSAGLWFLGGDSGFAMWVLPMMIALLMAYAISADISYDNTAFSLHLLASVPGRADRLGRVVAMLVVATPLVALGLVLWLVWLQQWPALPAMAGVCAALLLGGGGVVSVVSARYTYPTPPPGASPMKTPQGFTVLNLLLQFVLMALMVLLALPPLVLLFVHLGTGAAVWSWAALAVGLAEGAILLWTGVRVGGKWLEARGPELLQEVAGYR